MNTFSKTETIVPWATRSKVRDLYLPVATVVTVVLVTIACLVWNHDHPYPFNWDEALYVNEVQVDINHFHERGIHGLLRSWLDEDIARPPAYRMLAFPFALVFGATPLLLRTVAILSRLLALWLIYVGVRSVGGRGSALLAVMFLALSPDVVFYGTIFWNEYALYLATAGTCCFILRSWNQSGGTIFNCFGLGICLGLGALAKASFPVPVGCLLLMVAFLGWRKKITGPSPQFLLNASVIGALISAPWWLFNFRSAYAYVKYAMDFSRYETEPPGLRASLHYGVRFLQEGFGFPLGCLFLALLVWTVIRRFGARSPQPRNPATLVVVCALLAPLPTCLVPLTAPNEVIYHVSQSLIIFAIGFALLAQTGGWLSAPIRFLVLNVAILTQLALILTPVVTQMKYNGHRRYAWTDLGRWEQWNWNQVRLVLRSHGMEHSSIGCLGCSSTFNPPEILHPWLSHHDPPPTVTLLWREERGSADVEALVSAACTNDVVLTAPELTLADWNSDQPDNQYNTEFSNRLIATGLFQKPLLVHLGRFHPVDVWVFVRNHLSAR